MVILQVYLRFINFCFSAVLSVYNCFALLFACFLGFTSFYVFLCKIRPDENKLVLWFVFSHYTKHSILLYAYFWYFARLFGQPSRKSLPLPHPPSSKITPSLFPTSAVFTGLSRQLFIFWRLFRKCFRCICNALKLYTRLRSNINFSRRKIFSANRLTYYGRCVILLTGG